MIFLSGLAGILLLAVILHDVFEVLLLPRRVHGQLRLVRLFFRSTWSLWATVGRRISQSDPRSHFLSLYGPLSMVLLLIVWACGLVFGFALVQHWLASSAPRARQFATELYLSGTTLFTLGYGDVTPQTHWAKVAAVVEAGTGFGFIAVVIGYLPVLYQLFSKREAKVIQLDARAGSPPTAVLLLARHTQPEALDRLLESWEEWCSEVVESHLSYPMLSYYRSQHDNESWLAAVTAIMDCCAILLVGLKGRHSFQARMTFAMSRLTITELTRIFQTAVQPPAVNRLPADGFRQLRDALSKSELEFDDDDAENRLLAFRATYEPFLFGLSEYLLLPLPPWVPVEDSLDNWQNSPRGRSAKRLIDAVPTASEQP